MSLPAVRAGAVAAAAAAALAAALAVAAPWVITLTKFKLRYEIALLAPVMLAIVLVCWLWRDPPDPQRLADRFAAPFARLNRWSAALLVALVAWLVGGVWLQGFPISDDIYAVVLQAQTFATGHLTAPAPPLPAAFEHPRFAVVGDIWVSQYPPGWALLLTPLTWLGAPEWLVPGAFAAGVVLLTWRLARRRLDRGYAILAVAALCVSAFFVLNASTPYAHIATAFFGLAAFESALNRRAGGGWAWALLAGAMIGAVGLIRPFNAVIFIAILGAAFIVDAARARNWSGVVSLIAFGAGGVPFVLVLMGYHEAVTGSPFTTIPQWMGHSEPLGPVTNNTLDLTIRRGADLALTMSPILAAAALIAPLALWRTRQLELTDLVFPVTIVAFLFYGGSGGLHQSYGPRYYFEATPFFTLSAVALAAHFAPRYAAVRAAVAAHFIFASAALIGWLAFERVAIYSLSEPYRLVRAAHLEDAVVVIGSAPGKFRLSSIDDFTRNGIDVTAPSVIYALDLGDGGAALHSVFPDRALWLYRDGALAPLDPLRDASRGVGAGEAGARALDR